MGGVEWGAEEAQEGEGSGGQESAEEFGSYSELRVSHWQFQVVEYFSDLTFSKSHVNCCVENGTQVFKVRCAEPVRSWLKLPRQEVMRTPDKKQ